MSACLAAGPVANAQEVFKWKDANGKVHYGDRAAAPEDSGKLDIKVNPPSQPSAIPTPAAVPPLRPPVLSPYDPKKKSVPVDAARVGPECKGLIDKIAAVPSGKSWKPLYQQFDNACPRIAYECVEYRSKPQNNQCNWVERSGGVVLRTESFP